MARIGPVAGRGSSAPWRPPADVPHHDGGSIPPSRVFFCPAPAEIGPLLSADGTLCTWDRPRSRPRRVLVAALAGAGVPACSFVLSYPYYAMPGATWWVAGLALAVAVYLRSRFIHVCSYVGVDGIAEYTLSGGGGVECKVFLFREASELHMEERDVYIERYTGTNWQYWWSDGLGRTVYAKHGMRDGRASATRRRDPYWFAAAAVAAWNQRQTRVALAEIAIRGYAQFRLPAGQFLRVGNGFLEFPLFGEWTRVAAREVAAAYPVRADVELAYRRESCFGGSGTLRIALARAGNADVLRVLLGTCVGIRLPGGST